MLENLPQSSGQSQSGQQWKALFCLQTTEEEHTEFSVEETRKIIALPSQPAESHRTREQSLLFRWNFVARHLSSIGRRLVFPEREEPGNTAGILDLHGILSSQELVSGHLLGSRLKCHPSSHNTYLTSLTKAQSTPCKEPVVFSLSPWNSYHCYCRY
jgi:hypothetical protein